jgi:hypothetical protein
MSGLSVEGGEVSERARVVVSAEGEVRVLEGADGLLPLLLEGPYFSHAARVGLVGVLTGERVELKSMETSTGIGFVVDWPPACSDQMLEIEISDAERDAAGVRIPAITMWAPGAAPERASRLSWSAPSEHGLFDVKLVTADQRKVKVDQRLVLSPRYTVAWSWLAFGSDYRAIVRGHDGRTFTDNVGNVMLSVNDEELAASRADVAGALGDLRAVLTSGDPSRRLPPSVLSLDRSADSPELARLLCRILFDVFEGPDGVHRRAGALNFRWIEALAPMAAGQPDGSAHMRDALEYLSLYGIVDRYFIEQGFDSRFLRNAVSIYDFFTHEHGEALLERLRQSPAYREGSFGAGMVDGLVLSTFDREAAARSFQLAKRANPDMWSRESDQGAGSYLSHEYVQRRASELSDYKRRLVDSLSFVTAMPRWKPGDHMYVCPCERTFFRIYFPLWLNVAEYLKARRVSFHFLLYADQEEAAELVQAADSLRRELGSLRGRDPRDYADNISFSAVPIPDDVVDPKGFYVCARFLLARRIGSEYQGPVLMHDIDMFFREDPKPYLDSLDPDRVGVQLGDSNLATLKPWRRFVGNNLYVPFSERVHDGLAPMEDYLIAGWSLELWVTDQNALTYFVERAIAAGERDTLISSLGGARHGQPMRPTASERIKKLMEPDQRRSDAEA